MSEVAPKAVLAAWADWRGPDRAGRAPLPKRLPAKPAILWRTPLPGRGLGGVAATSDIVIVSYRDLMDTADAWVCLDARTGKETWKVVAPAPVEKELDYGNTPRATPVVTDKHVFLSGATGLVMCVERATGKTVWEKDIRDEFEVKDDRKWGLCSTPLLVGDRVILNPGGKTASIVAVEAATGKVVWKTPGAAASYGNLVCATLGGVNQVVGFDLESLGGWDAKTGKRLWTIKAENRSDFNVPTPVVAGDKLVVAWENNGTFLYGFGKGGVIEAKALGSYNKLAPDTHTPVLSGKRLFGAWNGLHCLDVSKNLAPVYFARDAAFGKYATLVASDDRVLAVPLTGELILIDATADKYTVLDRRTVMGDETGVHSHPAIVGTRLYVRGDAELVCVDLA